MNPEFQLLISRYVAGNRDEELIKKITGYLEVDRGSDLLNELRDELALDGVLHEQYKKSIDPEPILKAIATHTESKSFEKKVMGKIKRTQARRVSLKEKQHWFGRIALASAALLMIGIIAAISQPFNRITEIITEKPTTPTTTQTEATTIGSIAYIQSVEWPEDAKNIAQDGSRLKTGDLSLSAGVIELRLDNGVVLALEGPMQLEVLSPMTVALKHGRITTNVPPSAIGFTVTTTKFSVVDQGTEVGVELSPDGQAHMQVFTGAVDIHVNNKANSANTTEPQRLGNGDARLFNPKSDTLFVAEYKENRYIRTGPLRPIVIDVADLVAGGNGRGNGKMVGINVVTSEFQEKDGHGESNKIDTALSIEKHPFIDFAFLPNANATPTVVDSLNHAYFFNNKTNNTYKSLIRPGGLLLHPNTEGVTKPTPTPTQIGDIDYGSFGHQLIGMHASCGFTIDLHAIAKTYNRIPTQFSAIVANIYNGKARNRPGTFVVLVDGELKEQVVAPLITEKPNQINISLTKNDRFLTLVSTDGGQGSSAQWTTLGDPRLILSPNP